VPVIRTPQYHECGIEKAQRRRLLSYGLRDCAHTGGQYYNERAISGMPGLKFVPGSTSIGRVKMLSVLGIVWLLASGCRQFRPQGPASIEFTRLPPAGPGNPKILHTIEGRVTGAQPGQRIVLFARSGAWWVQPLRDSRSRRFKPIPIGKTRLTPETHMPRCWWIQSTSRHCVSIICRKKVGRCLPLQSLKDLHCRNYCPRHCTSADTSGRSARFPRATRLGCRSPRLLVEGSA
jgi:hypothetical protein